MQRLTRTEDTELRWLAEKGTTAALTSLEQRRLASLRLRDRRGDVRARGSEGPVAIPVQIGVLHGEQGPAYRLSRRLVDLIVVSGGVQVILLLAMNDDPSYEQLIAVLPEDIQPKAQELLDAITAQLAE